MKKFTLLTLLTLLAVTAFAQKAFVAPNARTIMKADADNSIITEQPAGNLMEYTRLGGACKLNSAGNGVTNQTQSGYAYIVYATDGSGDVWLKDPVCWFNTGAWVKGSLSADKKTITVPTGQNLSVNSEGLYLRMELADLTTNASGTSSVSYNSANTQITYTIDDNVIRLNEADGENHVLAVMWSDDHAWQGYADWGTSYIDMNYNPDNPVDPTQPVTAIPDDLQTENYLLMLFDLSFGSDGKESGRELVQTDAKVGFKDGKVYIQGLSGFAREGWVVGTVNGNTVTIPSGQYQGVYNYNGNDYPIYVLGCDSETEEVKDLVFSYDSESGTLELQEGLWIVDNSDANTINIAFGVYDDAILLKGGSTDTTIPADLETEDYLLMLFDLSFGSDGKESGRELVQTDAKVGFKDGKVYIQGLSGFAREGWVVGTVDGNTVTIPSGQYQGIYNYGGTDRSIYILGCDSETEEIKDLVFSYDSESGTLELQEGLWIVDSGSATTIDAAGVYDSAILLKGSTDGISGITTAKESSDSYYNLQGVRMSGALPKGIYIHNGKKVVIK